MSIRKDGILSADVFCILLEIVAKGKRCKALILSFMTYIVQIGGSISALNAISPETCKRETNED